MVPGAALKLGLWLFGIHPVPILSWPEECSQQAECEMSLLPEYLLKDPHPPGQGTQRCHGRTSLSWGDKAVRCRVPPLKPAGSLEKGGWTDGWTDGRGPTLRAAGHPLPGQEARSAAELNEELPFTEPVGLYHLAESLVSIAACVVGDARGSQLREACLTSAAVPAGAFTAQAALVTPSTHFVGQARHLLWVEALATGRHTSPVLEVEVCGTVNTFFSAGPYTGLAGVMAFPTPDLLRVKVGARLTVWNTAAPCKAESFFTDSTFLWLINTFFTAWVAFKAVFLTFISIKPSRTEGHTGVHLLMVIEPSAARQALGCAPARACLTPLVAAATASCSCVPKVAQGARAHALPARFDAPQAEVDTVQALVCVGAITAFVTTLRMAHTGL